MQIKQIDTWSPSTQGLPCWGVASHIVCIVHNMNIYIYLFIYVYIYTMTILYISYMHCFIFQVVVVVPSKNTESTVIFSKWAISGNESSNHVSKDAQKKANGFRLSIFTRLYGWTCQIRLDGLECTIWVQKKRIPICQNLISGDVDSLICQLELVVDTSSDCLFDAKFWVKIIYNISAHVHNVTCSISQKHRKNTFKQAKGSFGFRFECQIWNIGET